MYRFLIVFLLSFATAFVPGCKRQGPIAEDVQVDLAFEPSPPNVGDAKVSLVVSDSAGNPLDVTGLVVEGNMNHAGMKPSFATIKAAEKPGHYEGTLDFTMGGDWFMLVTGTLPDGRRLERKIDVPGVQVP